MNNRCLLAEQNKKEEIEVKVKELEKEELDWSICKSR